MLRKFSIILIFSSIIYSSDLDSLILQIKQAPPSQKRVLINKLKLQLRSIHQTNRLNILKKLRSENTINKVSSHIDIKSKHTLEIVDNHTKEIINHKIDDINDKFDNLKQNMKEHNRK